MAIYQLPALKDEKLFEELICDLFNYVEKTSSYENIDYQIFGVKGQNQKGIDVFSTHTKTVIQCKLKSLKKKDENIRKDLIQDIDSDLEKAKDLKIDFVKFIFVSTFRDDAQIQEYLNQIKKERELPFHLYYWGWDTITKHIEQSEPLLHKYFSKFVKKSKPTKQKIELPEGALGRDLQKKNYINYLKNRYGDWKQIELEKKGEKFNWAAFTFSLTKRYKASGINHIDVRYFDDLASYLHTRIDGTIMGKVRKSKGQKNYSTFEELNQGISE
ncbi:endonuclease [Elizabethkingia anophelis]|uniref:endonuclease n=1 Tax=Elizabethkingia anophelis TaxID=1117645 RepID=UPI00136EC2DE|nr:endonuclease [Elizabethkingia anophelis]MYY43998.1 endonuclease [Elizabethkingia anophelis]